MTIEKKIAWEKYDIKYGGKYDEEEDDEEEGTEWTDDSPFEQLIMAPVTFLMKSSILLSFSIAINVILILITPKILKTVELVTGIEIMIPVTRYSFIIGIGKLFSEIDVKSAVGNAHLGKTP